MTQPPDDHTQRFDPYGDDRTRAIPPANPPADEPTQFFPFGDSGGSGPGNAGAQPPRGSAEVRGRAVYQDAAAAAAAREVADPEAARRKKMFIIGGAIAAVILVILAGYGIGTVFAGGGSKSSANADGAPAASDSPSSEASPTDLPSESPSPSDSPSASPTPSPKPSPSPSPKSSPSPPPPLGPRLLLFKTPDTENCTVPGSHTIKVSWKSADADTIQISVDSKVFQVYAPPDSPADAPFPCDGKSHTYTARALNNSNQASAPITRTVQPTGTLPSPSPSP